MPKIAIITINYNDKTGLEKTIKSVIGQTFTDYEFLVIDGGSNDGSKEVIAQYASNIHYWVSEKDSGVYNAQNKGIKASNSEFVIFMNAGDVFEDAKVLEVVAPQLTSDYDICYGNNYKVKENGSKRLKTYPERLDFSFFYTSTLNHQSTFIRKSLFDTYFYYTENFKIASDWEFFIYTICKENVPYKYLNVTICQYDFTGMSSTGKYEEYARIEREQVLQKYFTLFTEDYKRLNTVTSKRVSQFLHLQQFGMPWKLLKGFMSLLLLFVPKMKK
ncbi:glycosyltransferase family 2 protein [Flavobacterium enshiense]|uniref:glycosyltransferase family 2 protein n=1 Tax=Flavobacterium enshiense TaxID=1341165 RepID=UPI00345D4DFB